jgi:gamma-glutamylcyclotransferase (GGCT)/AIG2-like uncharacterized protein YtfP
MSARSLVFVYGTLMRGHANHRVLVEVGARRVGDALTAEPRTLVDLGPYPALLAPGAALPTCRVAGEIYDVDDAALEVLDAFEGCPDLYARERIVLEHEGAELEAWTYVLAQKAPSHAALVTSGRYPGGGVVLLESAKEADALDKRPEISDVPPPRGHSPRGPR